MASYQTRTEPYVSQSFRKPPEKKQESVNKQEIFESWPSFWNEPSHSNLAKFWAFLLIAFALLRLIQVHLEPAIFCQGLLHIFAAGSHGFLSSAGFLNLQQILLLLAEIS